MAKLNYISGKCSKCKSSSCMKTSNDQGTEFEVCKSCGNVMFGQTFDTMKFLVEQIHDGVNKEEDLVELLCDTLGEVYYWMEGVDLETLSRLLVNDLIFEAKLTAEAEDNDAAEYEAERVEAMAGRY